jgi:hypothetical protein
VFSAKRLLFIWSKCVSLGISGRNCAIIQEGGLFTKQYPGNP